MKKFICSILIILFGINTYAATCSTDEISRLKSLAEKVEFSYDYTIKEVRNDEDDYYKYAEFSITAVNLNEDLKVMAVYNYYTGDNKEFKYNNTKKSTVNGFYEGEKVNIYIDSYTDKECSGKTILTKTIYLPYYNELSDSENCIDNSDFKYCSKIIDKRIDNEEFMKELEKYYNNGNNVENKDDNNNNEKINNSKNHYIYFIIGGIIFIGIIIAFIVFKSIKRKNDDLKG